MPLALAIDLGTTRIKAAALLDDGSLGPSASVPSPPLKGKGLIRESDPERYEQRARELLARFLSKESDDIPVGITSQRSSFLLWDGSSGRPVTPLISWQDRRATSWCRQRSESALGITSRTGLPLSPHYAGPKVACLFEKDKHLRLNAEKGGLLFGTLETWFIWKESESRAHLTDISMAGRTLLADRTSHDWSGDLLAFFGIPPAILPRISPTWGLRVPLKRKGLATALISDQASALSAVAGLSTGAYLINLGTGGFVLRPTGKKVEEVPGYLSGPISESPEGDVFFALEGTINGIGQSLAGFHGEAVDPQKKDSTPDLFCIPDTTGLGAPFWKPDLPQIFSRPPSGIDRKDLSRIIREGIIFRVCQLAGDMGVADGKGGLYLSGGLAGDPFLRQGLAACLGRPILHLRGGEGSLLGAARLASHLSEKGVPAELIPVASSHGYLREKFGYWAKWVREIIS